MMNRRSRVTMFALLVTVGAAGARAQELAAVDAASARTARPQPGGTLTAPSTAPRGSIVADFMRSQGTDEATAASLRQEGQRRDARSGLSHVTMYQEVSGLRVYGTYARAALNDQGELVHLVENVARVTPAGVVRARVDAAQALRAALQEVHPNAAVNAVEAGRAGNTTTFAGDAFFYRNPTVTAVALPMTDNVLRAGFVVETWSRATNELNHTVVNGDGRVLAVESRTNRDTYRVFLKDPEKGVQVDMAGHVPTTSDSRDVSPEGWLSPGSHTTLNITGNNAHAYLDTNNNNAPDSGGTAVSDGNFLASADLFSQPSTADNRNVAVQNLFYLNNVIHDELHRHGFDEAAGNFQTSNFGRGGSGNDAVNAEAQDGGGIDNANFATPTDGLAPRMQMYLWTGKGDHLVEVNSSQYLAAGASFGPALTTLGVSAALKLAVDSTAPTGDACQSIQPGQLTGKVAIVDRGTCNFTVKVRNAQAAGAIAVVVVSDDDSYFTMGGTDRKVTIPSVMVGAASGATIKAAAGAIASVRKNAATPLQRDGSVDADIVYHEYCHGLTWRMIGSMSGPLSGAIGEGMSDVCAVLLNGDDRVGEYSASGVNGIRRHPYANYPLTYGNVTGASVHDDGEIYGAIGWRLKENFAGDSRQVGELLGYLVQGMNNTAAGPYFEHMRDGILDAIPASDTVGHCLVWDAFADYGVGVGAKATFTRNKGKTVVSVTESFARPASCVAIP
jgi:hypothetical protein